MWAAQRRQPQPQTWLQALRVCSSGDANRHCERVCPVVDVFRTKAYIRTLHMHRWLLVLFSVSFCSKSYHQQAVKLQEELRCTAEHFP